jgi:hypothetical protein
MSVIGSRDGSREWLMLVGSLHRGPAEERAAIRLLPSETCQAEVGPVQVESWMLFEWRV